MVVVGVCKPILVVSLGPKLNNIGSVIIAVSSVVQSLLQSLILLNFCHLLDVIGVIAKPQLQLCICMCVCVLCELCVYIIYMCVSVYVCVYRIACTDF